MRDARPALAIGCDIGVTHVKSVVVTFDGVEQTRLMTDTDAGSPDWWGKVVLTLERLQSEHGRAEAIGIAAPGIAGGDGREIIWMRGRLDAVEGLHWARFLGRESVPVLNDAQAALMGEAWLGAARGAKNVAMLTLGTGVGGALMVDGRLLRGALGRAGHLGHISLDPDGPPDVTNCPGSLEHEIGNVTVEARTGGRFRTTHDLVAAHLAGDEEASRVWMRSVKALAAGVASIVNVADPDVFVIGGGIARAGDALFAPLQRYLDEFEWRPHDLRVRVVPAVLGEYAGALGAAWNAIRVAEDSENTR